MRNEVILEVVSPSGKKTFADRSTAAGIGDLSGKTVAVLWDYLFRGDELFEIVSRKLAERFPGMKFVPYTVFGNVHGPKQRELVAQIPAKLKEHNVDAVVSLVGA